MVYYYIIIIIILSMLIIQVSIASKDASNVKRILKNLPTSRQKGFSFPSAVDKNQRNVFFANFDVECKGNLQHYFQHWLR